MSMAQKGKTVARLPQRMGLEGNYFRMRWMELKKGFVDEHELVVILMQHQKKGSNKSKYMFQRKSNLSLSLFILLSCMFTLIALMVMRFSRDPLLI